MKSRNFLAIFISFFVFSAICIPYIYAEEVGLISQHYSEEGIKSYDSGEMDEALREFSKAVVSDPNNTEAREYLQRMGYADGIYGYEKRPAETIVALRYEADLYRRKADQLAQANALQTSQSIHLQAQNEALCNTVSHRDHELGQLNNQLKYAKDVSALQRDTDRETIDLLKHENVDHQRKIELYDRISQKHKKVLSAQENYLDKRDHYIRGLNEEMRLVRNDTLKTISSYENRLTKQSESYSQRLAATKDQLQDHQEYYSKRKELDQDQIHRLTKSLHKKREEVTQLKDDVLQKDLQLVKQESILRKDLDRMFQVEYKQKLDHNQRLLTKKDKQISNLTKQVTKLLKQLSSLEKQVARGQQEKLKVLKAQLNQTKNQLAQKTVDILEKDSDLKILQARLADAQQRLNLVQEVVDEKNAQIKTLEGEIVQMRDQMMK